MKSDLSALSPLEQWRHDALRLILPVILVFGLPAIASDLIGAWQRNDFTISTANELAYLGIVIITFMPKLQPRVRAGLMVTLLLTLGVAQLISNGLVGSGRPLIILAVVLAAFFFGSRVSTSLWLTASALVLLVCIGYGTGWIVATPMLRQRISEMPTLVANALATIFVAAMLGRGILSLVGRLSLSLRELAEANSSLERRVAERTAELEAALRQNRFLVAAVNNMTTGLVVSDATQPHNPVFFANPAFTTITGYGGDEIIGRNCRILQGPETDPAAAQQIRDAIAARRPVEVELLNYRKDGAPFWNALAVSPVFAESSNLIGYVGLQSDVTVRKSNEALVAQQLRYAQALAECSRLMLARGLDLEMYQSMLRQVLAIVRGAIDAGQVAISRTQDRSHGVAAMFQSYRLIARAAADEVPPQRPLTPEEYADMPDELNVWQHGGSFNGPVAGRFPNHPRYARYLVDNGVQSVFVQALNVGEEQWWGHITVTDHRRARTLDEATVRLVTTVAEMIVTFTEGWEAGQLLQEREALLREVGRMARVGGWEYDRETRSLRWSEEVYAIHEMPLDAAPPPIEEAVAFYAPEARPVIQAAVERCITEGAPWDLELPFVTGQGRRRWVRAIGEAVFEGDRVQRVRGTFQDITERKDAELALRQANETLQRRVDELRLLNQISQALARWTRLGQVLGLVSSAIRRFLGGGEAIFWELDNKKETLVPIGARHSLAPINLAEDPLAGRLMVEGQPIVAIDEPGAGSAAGLAALTGTSGLVLPLRLRNQVIGALSIGARDPRHVLTPQEVSLLQTVASVVAATIENARLFAQARQSAAAEERRRLARELHDSVSQALFAASVTADVLPELFELDPDEGREQLEEIRRQTRGALAEMRTLLVELRPEALVATPLDILFGHLAAAASAKLHGGVQASLAPMPLLPPEVRIALYRIGQEALANVFKHARACLVLVRRAATPPAARDSPDWRGTIALEIADDGIGFDPQVGRQGGFGLAGMRERAAEIEASLAIECLEAGGTQIMVRWEGAAVAQEDRDVAAVATDSGHDRR